MPPRIWSRLATSTSGRARTLRGLVPVAIEDAKAKEALAGYYVSDPAERKRYCDAEAELHDPRVDAVLLFEDALRRLLAGGDQRATNAARIAAIQAQDERMAKLSAGLKGAAR